MLMPAWYVTPVPLMIVSCLLSTLLKSSALDTPDTDVKQRHKRRSPCRCDIATNACTSDGERWKLT
jgi:hypothetical protein